MDFFRGAVAKGDFYCSAQVTFGEGLIDAYLAQENMSIYPRIIISDEVLKFGSPSVDDEEDLYGATGYEGLCIDKDGYR